jgi:hypothetical protein
MGIRVQVWYGRWKGLGDGVNNNTNIFTNLRTLKKQLRFFYRIVKIFLPNQKVTSKLQMKKQTRNPIAIVLLLLSEAAAQLTNEEIAAQVEALQDDVDEAKNVTGILLPLVIVAFGMISSSHYQAILFIFGVAGAVFMMKKSKVVAQTADIEKCIISKRPAVEAPEDVNEPIIALRQVSIGSGEEVKASGSSEVVEEEPKEDPIDHQLETEKPNASQVLNEGVAVNSLLARFKSRSNTLVKKDQVAIENAPVLAKPGSLVNVFDSFDSKASAKVKIDVQLFSGSFGEVWKGTCQNREVVIKKLFRDNGRFHAPVVKLFAAEAKKISTMKHER